MKKLLAILCSIILCFCFVACDTSANNSNNSQQSSDNGGAHQLEVPENLRYDNGVLKWNIVDNASGYVLVIDVDEYSVSTNSFDVEDIDLSNGEHTAKIRSVGHGQFQSSDYSENILFTYDKIIEVGAISSSARFISHQNLDISYTSYKLDGLYYYIFNLGYIEGVPLQDKSNPDNSYRYTGETEITEALSTSSETSTTISEKVEHAQENCTTWNNDFSAHIGLTYTKELKFAGISERKLSLSVDVGYAHQWGGSTSKSSSSSVEEAETYSKKYGKTSTFKWTPNLSKVGWYRYVLEGTISMYACVIYDPIQEKYLLIDTYSVIDKTYWTLEYSEDSYFSNTAYTPLTLNDSCYSIIGTEPEKEYNVSDLPIDKDENESNSYVVNTTNILSKTNNLTITQDGYYGLQEKDYDVLDLSVYKNEGYFTKDYVFCFDVCVNISEKNNGYQEIYLYNQIKNTSKEVQISEAQDSYGMICGSVISHGGGSAASDHCDVWYVRGDQIKDTMYIRYDAHGDGDDTWYRRAIKVDLTIVTSTTDISHNNEEILFDENNRTIGHKGYYGLEPSRGHEDLNLSNYTNYMNEGYLFLFDVSIVLSEKDDGYQEIYLYNKDSTNSSDASLAKAREYGLLTGKMLEHGRGQKLTSSQSYNFVLTTTGDNIDSELKKLYIRYDAWGDDTDTWYKEKIKVTLTIVKIPDFVDDSTVTEAYKKF